AVRRAAGRRPGRVRVRRGGALARAGGGGDGRGRRPARHAAASRAAAPIGPRPGAVGRHGLGHGGGRTAPRRRRAGPPGPRPDRRGGGPRAGLARGAPRPGRPVVRAPAPRPALPAHLVGRPHRASRGLSRLGHPRLVREDRRLSDAGEGRAHAAVDPHVLARARARVLGVPSVPVSEPVPPGTAAASDGARVWLLPEWPDGATPALLEEYETAPMPLERAGQARRVLAAALRCCWRHLDDLPWPGVRAAVADVLEVYATTTRGDAVLARRWATGDLRRLSRSEERRVGKECRSRRSAYRW